MPWLNPAGAEMGEEDWQAGGRCFGVLMNGAAQSSGIPRRGEDATLLMVLNAYHDLVEFTLPETAGGSNWELLIDTNLSEDAEMATFATGEAYGVTGRSLLLFALVSDTAGQRSD